MSSTAGSDLAIRKPAMHSAFNGKAKAMNPEEDEEVELAFRRRLEELRSQRPAVRLARFQHVLEGLDPEIPLAERERIIRALSRFH